MSQSPAEVASAELDPRRWYTNEIKDIPEAMTEVLVKWSNVPEDKLTEHIENLRSRAFGTYPYPCIGQLRFLNLNLPDHPMYQTILPTLKDKTHTFLDVGCCFGQELRKLAFDGAPPGTLYGMDLEASFLEMSFELFQDKEKMSGATLLSGDLLDPAKKWPELTGKIDYIYASSLLHLFNRADQIKIACQLVTFTRNRQGALILGRQVGSIVAGEFQGLSEGTTTFRHNPASFDKLWQEVGRLTGTHWRTRAELDMKDIIRGVNLGQKWLDDNARRIHFVVERCDLPRQNL